MNLETESSTRKFYKVSDIAEILDIGINAAYALAKRKDFPSIRIGKTIRVGKEAFDEWVFRSQSVSKSVSEFYVNPKNRVKSRKTGF